MGPLDNQVLRSDALSLGTDGLDLAVYMHWYRALPLTSLAKVDLWLDGEQVDASTLEVTANGVRRSLADTAAAAGDYWFTTDPLVLHVSGTSAAAGQSHDVRFDLGLSIPYILIGPEQTPLVATSSNHMTLVTGPSTKEHS